MTIEEKRAMLCEWCLKKTGGCVDCALNYEGRSGNCYTEVDDATVLKHYDMVFNAVEHPTHYAYSKHEPVYVIRDWNLNFNLGNVVKYVARAGRKDDILQDLKKARQYLDFEIEALNENGK